jgi:hypothetical protein
MQKGEHPGAALLTLVLDRGAIGMASGDRSLNGLQDGLVDHEHDRR